MRKVSDEMTVGEAIDANAFVSLPSIKWFSIGALGRMRRDLSLDAREVSEAIGLLPFAMLRKAHRRRARTGWLSIPRTIQRGHWIRDAIGDRYADSLQQMMGGRKLDLRDRGTSVRAERDDWIRWHCWTGACAEAVAMEFGVTARQVRNLAA